MPAIVFTDIVVLSKLTALELLTTRKQIVQPLVQGIFGRDKFLIHEHRFERDQGNYAASLKAIESITADPFLSQSRMIPKSLARAFYLRNVEVAGQSEGRTRVELGDAEAHGDWRVENRCHVGSDEGSRSLQGDRPVSKP